jgi:chromate transporter
MQNLSSPNLSQLALLFLKIGIIDFGGLAAHIA